MCLCLTALHILCSMYIIPHACKYIYLYTNIVRKKREFFWFAHFWYCFSLVSLTSIQVLGYFGFELRLAEQQSQCLVLVVFSLHALLPAFIYTYTYFNYTAMPLRCAWNKMILLYMYTTHILHSLSLSI